MLASLACLICFIDLLATSDWCFASFASLRCLLAMFHKMSEKINRSILFLETNLGYFRINLALCQKLTLVIEFIFTLYYPYILQPQQLIKI